MAINKLLILILWFENSPISNLVPLHIGEFAHICNFLFSSIMKPSIAEPHRSHFALLKMLSASLSSSSAKRSTEINEFVFLHCSSPSAEGDEQCKNTNSLISVDLFADDDDKEAESIFNKAKCDLCGSAMDGFIIDEKRKLQICANSPICSGTKLEIGEFSNQRMRMRSLLIAISVQGKWN